MEMQPKSGQRIRKTLKVDHILEVILSGSGRQAGAAGKNRSNALTAASGSLK